YSWSYDALSRLTGEVYDYGGDDTVSGGAGLTNDDYTDAFTYDLNGNRLTQTEDLGNNGTIDQTITSVYNIDNQLTTETATSTTGTLPTYSTTYTYDANG